MSFADEPYFAYPPLPKLEDIHNGWSPERRKKHAEMMHLKKPWTKSTGPRTAEGKAKSAQNAYKHGRRSTAARHRAEGFRHLQSFLKHQRHLHTLAERRLRALRKMKKSPNELLNDPTLTYLNGLIRNGAAVLPAAIALVMQKPCILDNHGGKS